MTINKRNFKNYSNYSQENLLINNIYSDSLFRTPDESLPRDHTQEIFSNIIRALKRNNHRAALHSAEILCKKRSGNILCLNEYARHLITSGQYDNSITILNTILKINSNNLEAFKLFGYLELKRGNISNALELFAKSVRISPADSFSQINFESLRRRILKRRESLDNSPLNVTVATSLPPRNIETSRLAVDTWIKFGFKVISVNTRDEHMALKAYFPNVKFCISEDTARHECNGKDYQYLDTLLDSLVEYGEDVCGIINADIVLQGEQNSWNHLVNVAKDNFVFGSRINVNDLSQRYGLLLEPGFDFFFFPHDFPTSVPRTGFVFGQPAWDLFFPSWATITNTPCAFCYYPYALHVTHPTNWSATANSRFIAMALKWLAPNFADMIINYPGASVEYLRILTGSITKILNRSAKGKAKPLFLGGKELDGFLAPVDPCYWAHESEQTLVFFNN